MNVDRAVDNAPHWQSNLHTAHSAAGISIDQDAMIEQIKSFAPIAIGVSVAALMKKPSAVECVAKQLSRNQIRFNLRPKFGGMDADYNWFTVKKYKNLGELARAVRNVEKEEWGHLYRTDYHKWVAGAAGGLATFGVASLLNPDNSLKRNDFNAKFNLTIGEIKEDGRELAQSFEDAARTREEIIRSGIEEIEAMIAELPPSEQSQIREDLQRGLKEFEKKFENDRADIEEVLMNYASLEAFPEDNEAIAALKDKCVLCSSHLMAGAFGLALGSVGLAQKLFALVPGLPFSKKFFEKVIQGTVLIAFGESLKHSFDRDITRNELEEIRNDICAQIGVDPVLSEQGLEEKQIEKRDVAILVKFLAKVVSYFTKNSALEQTVKHKGKDLLKEGVKGDLNSSLKTEELDSAIEGALSPVYEGISELKGRVSRIGESSAEKTYIQTVKKVVEQNRAVQLEAKKMESSVGSLSLKGIAIFSLLPAVIVSLR